MSKKLVAWFSVSGVTAKVAREIEAVEGADCFEIVPEAPYTAADLDWTNKQSRSTLEMTDPNCRPATIGCVEDMAQYDVVFVGFPIWWGEIPNIVYTFMENHDFAGKTVIPFNTHEGSSQSHSQRDIENALPDATVLQRLHVAAIRGDVMPDDEAVRRRYIDVVARLQLSVAHAIFLHVHERRVVIRLAIAVET